MPITPKARKDLPDPEATIFNAAAAAEIETRTTDYADTLVTELGEQAAAGFQPKDADLDAIASEGTTALGRSLIRALSSAELRTITNAAAATHAAQHQLGGADALALPQYDPYDSLPYVLPMGLWPSTTIEPTINRAYLNRFTVSRKRSFKFVRFPQTAAGTGEDEIDTAIYVVNGAKMERVASSGAVKTATNAAGVKALELTSTAVCEPGLVYFVGQSWKTQTGSPKVGAYQNNGGFYGDLAGTDTLANRLMLFKAEIFPFPSVLEGTFATPTPTAFMVPSEV